MKDCETTAALRIDAAGIAEVAKAGVERALAARNALELSAADIEAVNGGAAVSLALTKEIIYGGPFAVQATGIGANTLPGQLAGGVTGFAR